MKEATDKYFKDKLAQHESEVPTGVWDRIETSLDETETKKRGAYWWVAAVVVVLFGASMMRWWAKPTGDVIPAAMVSVDLPEINVKGVVPSVDETPENILQREQQGIPSLDRIAFSALAIAETDMEVLLLEEQISWPEIEPPIKGKVLVKVHINQNPTQPAIEETMYADGRDEPNGIRIPTPKIKLANIFAKK